MPSPPRPLFGSLGAASIRPRQETSLACLVIGAGPRALTRDGVANNSLRSSSSVISCKRPRNLVASGSPEPQCREDGRWVTQCLDPLSISSQSVTHAHGVPGCTCEFCSRVRCSGGWL